jgi:hypothetical protein
MKRLLSFLNKNIVNLLVLMLLFLNKQLNKKNHNILIHIPLHYHKLSLLFSLIKQKRQSKQNNIKHFMMQ